MTLQINVMMRGGSDPSLPERVPGAQGRVARSITGLHHGAKMPTDFDREWGRFPGSAGRAPMLPIFSPITPQPHLRQRLVPIMMLQINTTTRGGSDASLPELPRRSDPAGTGRMHECTSMDSGSSGRQQGQEDEMGGRGGVRRDTGMDTGGQAEGQVGH